MMKRYFLFLLMISAAWSAFGQGQTDYYKLPDQKQQYERVLTRYGGAYIRNRWYVALDGFVRTDRAKIDNSFNGLIASDRVTKAGWSALIGWAYRERWAVETGYTNSPTHTEVLINSGMYPYTFRFANDKRGLVLRGKHMILSTSGPWRRSGFWLTGGVWLMPNTSRDEGKFALSGYGRHDWHTEKADTIRLIGQTTVNAAPTAMIEAGVEYTVRLNDRFDMGLSARKLWGLGRAVSTNVSYSVNSREIQQAQFNGMGNGMTFGLTMRYTYAIKRTMAKVLDIQGKRPAGMGRINLKK